MNKAIFVGNLVKDPELRSTQTGIQVCSFTIAVNRKKKDGQQEADFIQVSAWRQLAEVCNQYLRKGKKVLVTGPVSADCYTGKDGKPHAFIRLNIDEIEFLSPADQKPEQKPAVPQGYTQVEDEDLPF